jgi:hypothetical protein
LNQASDLLERASQARDQIKEKSAKAAALALEIADFFENDAIHQDEIDAGIYTTPYEVSLADENSTLERESGADQFVFYNGAILSDYFPIDRINFFCGRSQLLSWLSFIPNYQYPYAGAALTQTFDGVPKTAPDHAINATAELGFRSAFIEYYTLQAQGALQRSASKAAFATLQGATAKRKWDQADIDFKRRRTQAARDIADQKVSLAITEGGAFNYAEQVNFARNRLVRDLIDAISRLKACQVGLKGIYGRDSPLPALITTLIETGALTDVELVNLLELATAWVRDNIAFLAAFNMRDQGYSLTVSLRRALGEDQWRRGLRTGAWQLGFDLDRLPNQYCVRIRGVNMFTRGPAGIWKATLSVPDRSFYSAKDGTEQPVDQHDIALLRLGKVGPRSSERYQEIYGTTSLRNIAPFGNWRVTVDDRSTHSETRDSIQDIEIDFELLVRSQKRVV